MRSQTRRLTSSALVAVLLAAGIGPGLAPVSVAAADGPQLVRDLGPSELVQTFVSIGDRILFTAEDDVYGRELFVSDGTYDGTHLVKDIRPGSGSSLLWSSGSDNPNFFTRVGDRVFFLARDGGNGVGLYVSDGTSAGTKRLMRRRQCDMESKTLVAAGSRLVLTAEDVSGVCNLYITDGTVAGTLLARANVPAFGQPRFLNNHVFFVAGTDPVDGQLWKTDAVPGGVTKIIARFNGEIRQMTVSGSGLYFSVGAQFSSWARLWRTDGTSYGTKQLYPSAQLSPTNLTDLNGKLVFGVLRYQGDGIWNRSLWRTNGRNGGTWMLKDWGTDKYAGVAVTWAADDRVYMLAGEDLPGFGLWVSDGRTSEGTRFLANLTMFGAATVGHEIYGVGCYRDQSCEFGYQFLTSDGTPDGTRQIGEALNLLPDVGVAGNTVFLNVNGDLWRYVP